MPRSVVIYTSRAGYAKLKAAAEQLFRAHDPKPYTITHAQQTEAGKVRVRITALTEEEAFPFVLEQAENGDSVLASPVDRDVKATSYDGLIDDADRFKRVATIQLVSPTIVDVLHQPMPFPVTSSMFKRYVEVWDAFAPKPFPAEGEAAAHVWVTDFGISCVSTPRGAGAQGWVALEIEKGRTEEEIGLFNALIDFAFYAGTGLYTDEGLGQTRRMEKRNR
jgi:hypothetical protein